MTDIDPGKRPPAFTAFHLCDGKDAKGRVATPHPSNSSCVTNHFLR